MTLPLQEAASRWQEGQDSNVTTLSTQGEKETTTYKRELTSGRLINYQETVSYQEIACLLCHHWHGQRRFKRGRRETIGYLQNSLGFYLALWRAHECIWRVTLT